MVDAVGLTGRVCLATTHACYKAPCQKGGAVNQGWSIARALAKPFGMTTTAEVLLSKGFFCSCVLGVRFLVLGVGCWNLNPEFSKREQPADPSADSTRARDPCDSEILCGGVVDSFLSSTFVVINPGRPAHTNQTAACNNDWPTHSYGRSCAHLCIYAVKQVRGSARDCPRHATPLNDR